MACLSTKCTGASACGGLDVSESLCCAASSLACFAHLICSRLREKPKEQQMSPYTFRPMHLPCFTLFSLPSTHSWPRTSLPAHLRPQKIFPTEWTRPTCFSLRNCFLTLFCLPMCPASHFSLHICPALHFSP